MTNARLKLRCRANHTITTSPRGSTARAACGEPSWPGGPVLPTVLGADHRPLRERTAASSSPRARRRQSAAAVPLALTATRGSVPRPRTSGSSNSIDSAAYAAPADKRHRRRDDRRAEMPDRTQRIDPNRGRRAVQLTATPTAEDPVSPRASGSRSGQAPRERSSAFAWIRHSGRCACPPGVGLGAGVAAVRSRVGHADGLVFFWGWRRVPARATRRVNQLAGCRVADGGRGVDA
jgi:hypothetical protein